MMMHGTEDRLGYHAFMPRPVLITGVSSGIGLHAARYLAEHGVPVYGTVRKEADAARVAQIEGVEPLICDVADDAQVAQLRDAIVARGTGLWGLVNNAGVAHMGDLVDVPMHEMLGLFEVNVFGVQRVTQAVA
ncbi:MAG: SDR family NAD(P)-dependent oxidoreductase, partial [Bacteroidales bacterium]